MQSGPSLVRQISVRLVAAAVLVSLCEIIGVLAIYATIHRPKLASELVTAQADRVFDALTANDAPRSLSALDAPRGARSRLSRTICCQPTYHAHGPGLQHYRSPIPGCGVTAAV